MVGVHPLVAPEETCVLKGNDLLSHMIGKKVAATETIEEKDLAKVCTVENVEEVEET